MIWASVNLLCLIIRLLCRRTLPSKDGPNEAQVNASYPGILAAKQIASLKIIFLATGAKAGLAPKAVTIVKCGAAITINISAASKAVAIKES